MRRGDDLDTRPGDNPLGVGADIVGEQRIGTHDPLLLIKMEHAVRDRADRAADSGGLTIRLGLGDGERAELRPQDRLLVLALLVAPASEHRAADQRKRRQCDDGRGCQGERNDPRLIDPKGWGNIVGFRADRQEQFGARDRLHRDEPRPPVRRRGSDQYAAAPALKRREEWRRRQNFDGPRLPPTEASQACRMRTTALRQQKHAPVTVDDRENAARPSLTIGAQQAVDKALVDRNPDHAGELAIWQIEAESHTQPPPA